ncbi:UNVERIFIED_CONTAM: hypothetical protein GTU68_065623 [Idotea baltica]|nr:hypothetical protein [Idotea baltica]
MSSTGNTTGQVLILLGPPGAGKGTQALRLAAECEIPHISTGDLFRHNLKEGTELGKKAKGFMEGGGLVPDELVLDMLFDRVAADDCKGGYLLDGFPRTLPQAKALTEALKDQASMTLLLEVPEDVLVGRASTTGVCDSCGGELYRRKDDEPEVVKERLKVYRNETQPMVDYYRESGSLEVINGDQAPDVVFSALKQALAGGGC